MAEIDRVIAAFTDQALASPRSRRPPPLRPPRSPRVDRLPAGMTLAEATRLFQFALVRDALEKHSRRGRSNIAATAKTLGVARSFLYRIIEEMETSEPRPRSKLR